MNGGMLTVVHQYLLDVAMVIEGRLTDNGDTINWNEPSLPTVRLSRTVTGICRRGQHLKMDDFGFISLEDIQTTGQNTLTPGRLLAVIYTNPKARFQLTFPCTA